MQDGCLIVSSSARDYADELARTSDIPFVACHTAAEALEKHAGQSVLFGNPDMLANVLTELAGIQWVQSAWAGIKPLAALKRRDFVVTGIKGVFGPQMAEYTLGYLLAHELRVVERRRQQEDRNWFDQRSGVLQGKRLGVMGTGSIAAHIAQTARAFGLRTSGLSLSGAPSPGFDTVKPVTELNAFLADVDYLVSVLPDTSATTGLLDAAAFSALPAHAYFINIGRGNVVDETALIDALQNKQIAGATLDVFDEEPVPTASPLWDAPNLSITAHIAAISHPSLIVPIFVNNYRRYMNNESLQHVIDLDRGY